MSAFNRGTSYQLSRRRRRSRCALPRQTAVPCGSIDAPLVHLAAFQRIAIFRNTRSFRAPAKESSPLHSEISVLPFSSLYDSKDVSVLQGEALLSEDLFQSFVLVASKATLLVQLVTILYSICIFGIMIIEI